MDNGCKNTDRELYREPDTGNGAFRNSIHVTEGGGIGINVGGHVIVKSLQSWHALAVAAMSFTSKLHVGPRDSSSASKEQP